MPQRQDPEASDATPLLRAGHDPGRPAVSTAVAAQRLGLSRQSVAKMIADGRLGGYGIAGPRRTRWFAYADALSEPSAGAPGTRAESSDTLELRGTIIRLLNASQLRREADRHRDKADALLAQAHHLMTEAVQELRAAYGLSAEVDSELEQVVASGAVPDTVVPWEPEM
jgi:hypothetical protein